jgi:hypothetical protein
VIKFVSDLRQVDGFLRIFQFPPLIYLTATITAKLLKVALNTIKQPNQSYSFKQKMKFVYFSRMKITENLIKSLCGVESLEKIRRLE